MNIFLIEDEPPILRSLKNTIHSLGGDYTVIGTAGTGQAAMDFIRVHHNEIDVMITDIQIPIITGLELTAYTARNYPDILTVILTGYSRFEYARTALQNGVFDYLLKPVDKKELENLLRKAYAQKCVSRLNTGMTPRTSGSTPPADQEGYVLSLFCCGPYQTGPAELSAYGFINACPDLKTHMKKYLPEDAFWIIPGNTPADHYVLFFLPDGDFDTAREKITGYYTPLLTAIPTVTVVISPDYVSLSSIRTEAARLRESAVQHAAPEKPQILYCGQETPAFSSDHAAALRIYHDRLAGLLAQKSLVFFHTELKNYIRKMHQYLPPQHLIFELLCDLFRLCFERLPSDIADSTDAYTIASDVINCSESYAVLFENLNSIFDSYFEMLLKDTPSPVHKEDIIMQVDTYIKENYSKDINTTTIAEHFNFTPAYLSKLFREHKSVTPSAYLLQIRINKAKELLKDRPEYKIKDVAAYIGYEDPLYFSKVFKKAVGMSPREFQETV